MTLPEGNAGDATRRRPVAPDELVWDGTGRPVAGLAACSTS